LRKDTTSPVVGRNRKNLQGLVKLEAKTAIGDLGDVPFLTETFERADGPRLAVAQVDAAVAAARTAAQPAKQAFAIGFLTGHEMNWLSQAMHLLRDELKNIQVTQSERGLSAARGPRDKMGSRS
jgi:LysR family hca operon transcriptional activator